MVQQPPPRKLECQSDYLLCVLVVFSGDFISLLFFFLMSFTVLCSSFKKLREAFQPHNSLVKLGLPALGWEIPADLGLESEEDMVWGRALAR